MALDKGASTAKRSNRLAQQVFRGAQLKINNLQPYHSVVCLVIKVNAASINNPTTNKKAVI